MKSESLRLVQKKVCKKYASKAQTSGNKLFAAYNVMIHLEKSMLDSGASRNDIMVFEKDFLEQNGLVIPESFFSRSHNHGNSIEDFLSVCTIKSNEKMIAGQLYSMYEIYCKKNNVIPVGKMNFYDYLRSIRLLCKSATVNGLTHRNVVVGVSFCENIREVLA